MPNEITRRTFLRNVAAGAAVLATPESAKAKMEQGDSDVRFPSQEEVQAKRARGNRPTPDIFSEQPADQQAQDEKYWQQRLAQEKEKQADEGKLVKVVGTAAAGAALIGAFVVAARRRWNAGASATENQTSFEQKRRFWLEQNGQKPKNKQ